MSIYRLIILGNGIDLNSGLESRYSDFYKKRFSDNDLQVMEDFRKSCEYHLSPDNNRYLTILDYYYFFDRKNYYRYLRVKKDDNFSPTFNFNDISFWDLYFIFSKESIPFEWNSIENQILSFLEFIRKSKSYSEGYGLSRTWFNNTIYLASSYFYLYFPKERFSKFKSIDNFLKSELLILEKSFSKYLNSEIIIHHNYHKNYANLFDSIKGTTRYEYVQVIDFNYTNPFLRNVSKSDLSISHVHGSLEKGDIIFGIDSQNIKPSSPDYKFTKTYRQLIGNYASRPDNPSLPNKNTLECIVFYGHSLSKADYAYFQSMFDHYNIYDSDVKLIFFYSIYDLEKSLEIKSEMVERVIKLLEAYSATITNQDHGKNLIHKLLLENRISISNDIENFWNP